MAGISGDLADKLAAVGLTTARRRTASITLKQFLDEFTSGRPDVKTGTRTNWRTARARMEAFFGADKFLAEITAADADAWLYGMRAQKYAPATIGRTVKHARQFFRSAVRKGIISTNPFADLKAPGQANMSRNFFVTLDMAKKVLDECPDAQWRLIVALSRFGGLRCPSEHLALEWSNIDWARDRMLVKSPKKEHLEGNGERWVPIFPELREHLAEAFERAEPGAVFVVTRFRDECQNLRTQLTRIVRRAGLKPWPRLFQNLRSSRETELANSFPIHVVCSWLGNSVRVAGKHYLQVTDEHFECAAKSGASALQKAVQQPAATCRMDSQDKAESDAGIEVLREVASGCESLLNAQMTPTRFELVSRP